MKKAIALMTMLGIACPAFGGDFIEACKMIGTIGEASMTRRQASQPMSQMLIHIENQTSIGFLRDTARQIIIAAYDQPAWATSEFQSRAIAEHKIYAEMLCYRELSRLHGPGAGDAAKP